MSQGPDERAAAGLAGVRTFPLDGAGDVPGADLVISEIMRDPASVADTAGEWFELFNPGTEPVDIDGWTIRDDDRDSHVIANSVPLLVPAGGTLVLGRNGDPAQNGGYHAHYVYTGIKLANGVDEIELVHPSGRVVDRIAYTGADPWPHTAGSSMALSDPTADNSNGSNWGTSTTRGGSFTGAGTDHGTPGDV